MIVARRLARALPLAALAVLIAAAPLRAQISQDSVKRTAIRRLLGAQKTDSVFLAGLDQALAAQPPDPNVPAGFMEAFRERARRDIAIFIERLVPAYDSAYSLQDVNGLLQFYETSLGQRMLQAQARLLVSIQSIGESWGMELAGQLLVDLARQPRTTPKP